MRLRESRDAFAHAIDIAEERGRHARLCRDGSISRSSPLCSNRASRLRTARRAVYAGMVGADRLRCGPMRRRTREVAVDWPDAIRVDGGLVGGGRLGWPSSASEDETPPWLVFGAMSPDRRR